MAVFAKKDGSIWVDVVPGSGQSTSTQATAKPPQLWEIEEPADPDGLNKTNLHEATRFNFSHLSRLPYTGERFSQGQRDSPVFGRESTNLLSSKAAAKVAAQNADPAVVTPPVVTVKRSRATLVANAVETPQSDP
jgi:hypothetical protein